MFRISSSGGRWGRPVEHILWDADDAKWASLAGMLMGCRLKAKEGPMHCGHISPLGSPCRWGEIPATNASTPGRLLFACTK